MDAELFLRVAEHVEDVLAGAEVARRWNEPSALRGYSVGGLAGHLARAVLTVERYLDAPPPEDGIARTRTAGAQAGDDRPPDDRVTDAPGYLVAVLAGHDPVDSAFHQSVRNRGDEEASGGPAALVERLRAARSGLAERLAAVDPRQRIAVLGETVMSVEDYLDTRLVELVVHLDDLVVSVGGDTAPQLAPEAYERVACVLASVAARRVSGLALVRSLSRAERHPEAVRAL